MLDTHQLTCKEELYFSTPLFLILLIFQPSTSQQPVHSYQLVPASSSYQQPAETNQLDPVAYEQELANRYEPEPPSSAGLFSTPYGKPPVSSPRHLGLIQHVVAMCKCNFIQ